MPSVIGAVTPGRCAATRQHAGGDRGSAVTAAAVVLIGRSRSALGWSASSKPSAAWRVQQAGRREAAWSGCVAAADVAKFRLVFDLCDAGVRMYRQRMRRESPAASDEEIEARVQAWLRRPTGETGDRLRLPARG